MREGEGTDAAAEGAAEASEALHGGGGVVARLEKQEEAVVLNRRRSKTFTMMLSLLSRFCAEASAVRENCLAGGFLKISFFF